MKKEFELLLPSMPNYIIIKQPLGKRQDGVKPPKTIAIEELSVAEAEQYAEEMKRAFLEHWETKRDKLK